MPLFGHKRDGKREVEDDVAEEIDYHLDRMHSELQSEGVNAEDAPRLTRERFGDPSMIRAQTRDIVAASRLDGLVRELRYAWRSLRREPLTTIAVTLCIGLGIGVAVSLFSVADALMLNDVTARQPDRLVRFTSVSYPVWRDVRDSGVFEEVAAGGQCTSVVRWRQGDQQRAVTADCLSSNFWQVVGGTAAVGRLWSEPEARLETNPHLLVLGHRFARLVGKGPDVIGQTLVLNDVRYTVVGVLPPTYKAIQGYGITPDVYLPFNLDLHPQALDRNAPVRDRLWPVARLRADATAGDTRNTLSRFLGEPLAKNLRMKPVSGLGKYASDGFDAAVLALLTLVGAIAALFMLIAYSNATGMVLARAMQRDAERQIRRALGATSADLVVQHLIEAALLGVFGTAAGVGICFLVARLMSSVAVPVQDVTLSVALPVDIRVLATCAVLGAASVLGTGCWPLIQMRQRGLAGMNLRVIPGEPRARRWLFAVQVGLSTILVFGTLLASQNARLVTRQHPGFEVDRVAWLDLAIDRKLPPQEREAVRTRIRQALDEHPDVESLSWAWYLPFQAAYGEPTLSAEGGAIEVKAIEQGVGPRYFETMRIGVLHGREFSDDDIARRAGPPVAVINESLAQRLFPDRVAVGATLWRHSEGRGPTAVQVIGVVANTPFRVPGEHAPFAIHSLATASQSFVVRTRLPASTALSDLTRTIDAAAPGASGGGYPFADRMARASFPARAMIVVFALFGGSGVILTLTCLIGLVSFNVARRRREIAIRLALGSTPSSIVWLLLRDHLTLVIFGSLAGCVAGISLSRRYADLIAGSLSPLDLTSVTVAIAVMLAVSATVVVAFARRPSRSSPTDILTAE